MKKLSFSLKNHITHRLYLYILAVILIPAALTYGIILKTNPKPEEMFTVFVDANINDSEAFKSYIKQNTDEKDKETTIYSHLSSMNTYDVVYQTQGLNSDILILSENGFKNDYAANLVEINDENSYYSITNKMVEDKHFGIEIFDGKDGYLKDYIKYNDGIKYYIFINNGSVHTKNFKSDGTTEEIFKLLGAIYG